ncbi:MAG TPA: glycosyltransferase family 1 protein [Urbifossiella sp.]|jgi:glycosyltransferase involved in cell wall biosynthesis|nr:glycosyltransferase family 1 protein [Urbifossiella sp.]
MRIGIDIDWLAGPRRDGLYNHAAGLLAGLREAGLAAGVSLYTWNRGPGAAPQPGFRVRDYRPPARLWRVRKRLERFSRYGRLDVFQTMTHAGFPPAAGRLNAYLVPDLTTLRVPECHTAKGRADWAAYLDQVRAHADLIVTWTNHTRDDVTRELGVPTGKVVAVPLGCSPEFRPVPAAEVAPVLAPLGLEPGRYILTVGTIEPRKNHITLFRAYAALKARGRVAGIPLVVVGSKGWGYDPILAEIDRLGLTADVRLVGFAESLPALYSGAAAMVYPSRYEGFGLPPLEAMACGCPVVTSNATSLPEVVGDAGLLADPDDVDGFADHLGRVLAEPESRARLSAAARGRAAGFTWRRYAEGLFAAYRLRLAARRERV